MPKIFRSMLIDAGKPVVGSGSNMLGIRASGADITADADGNVKPNGHGLSVSPCWNCLLPHLIPKRLKSGYPASDARGSDRLVIWTHGAGSFTSEAINTDLHLHIAERDATHGVIEPSKEMSLTGYQTALADTQDEWTRDETHRDDCPFCKQP